MVRHVLGLALVLGVGWFVVAAAPKDKVTYPFLTAPRDKSGLGVSVQRTMTLLATSTPQHRHKVRILFYGQSITEQDWWKQVALDLRMRFPHADLEIENRAIGGFASQLLIRPAEHDLYPFYPDLLIFHVYGSNGEYEQIIKNTRTRTTAEVLMQKDHAIQWPPEVIDQGKDKGAWWDNLINQHILPDIARKYGCGLADIRGAWLDYLKANHLEPRDLLKDGVHLNDHGNFLMAELVKRYLIYRPDLPDDGWRQTVRTFGVGKEIMWKDGKLVLEFEGNRVDALAVKSGEGGAAQVLIDGKKPSEFPEAYRITRPTPGPWSPLTVTRVGHVKPLLLEEWILKVSSVKADSSAWEFDVSGSRTGPDGHGSSGTVFESKSGRVRIEPGAWFRHGQVPAGHEIRCRVLPMFTDRYEAPKVEDSSREYSTVLVQGISNSRHRLEISSEEKSMTSIGFIRVYRPSAK